MIVLVTSCTVPKRYQKDKPFVYKTTIALQSDLPRKESQELKERLNVQIDDSLKVTTLLSIRAMPPFFYYKLDKPVVFDTMYIGRSKTFMSALLNSQGYFNPQFRDSFYIDTVKDQLRTYVNFTVIPGKVLKMDSIGYDFKDSTLQSLAMQNSNRSLLKRNDPYRLETVNGELDRLLNIYRNNGYFKLAKEDLYVEHDTVVAALIDPTIDPFEQLRLLDSLQKKRENPTVAIVFKQREAQDSTHLRQYSIGNVTVYPDAVLTDSLNTPARITMVDSIRMVYTTNKFKLPFIAKKVSLRPGNLYRIDDYFKTINTFTNLGAWQQVIVDLAERSDSTSILDPIVKLYPARRQTLSVDFETSRNASDAFTAGSLFGLGVNFGLNNRNAFRESIQSTSNLRFGAELGTRNVIQTVQASFSQSLFIPKLMLPFRSRLDEKVTNGRTVANFNTAYTNRRDFFQARSVNTSFGYNWSRRRHNWQYIPFNFEYTTVDETDSLRRVKERIPSLAFAFNNGLIISQILSYNHFKIAGKHRRSLSVRVEESGAIFGTVNRLDRGELKRFIKADVEYKYFIENKNSTWAFRGFAGYGFVYGKEGDSVETNLPFFKAYFAGGPYSMRAWRVRQLGWGSNILLDTARGGPFDRYGDVKFEGNIEYRFNLGRVFGIKVQSALFTDFGNIWLADRKDDPRLEGSKFSAKNFMKDLAVAGGTSLRVDFDFFLIRFDWAYKLKNPLYKDVNNGWFQQLSLKDGTFQLGIGYPF